jgi:DNA-binding CsgD family transcriptional regulator
LTVRLIVRESQYLLILEERRAAPAAKDLASFGLSTRESEILDWVAQGKTNPEVGMILGISRRTVQKHLERIYIKLGVENRTATAARVQAPHNPQTGHKENDLGTRQ